MTTLSQRPLPTQVIDVEIVVPVYNEARALRASVLALQRLLPNHAVAVPHRDR